MATVEDGLGQRERREELGQSEDRPLGAVEPANSPIVFVDLQNDAASWNQAAEKTSGFLVDENKGRSQPPFDALSETLKRLAEREEIHQTEADSAAAGPTAHIAWTYSPMRGKDGNVVGVVALGTDLTEKRRLKVEQARSAMMSSVETMAVGIAAHELRNSLAIISSNIHLLLDHYCDNELHAECAKRIQAGTERAGHILESWLSGIPLARGQMMDITALLEESVNLLIDQLTSGNVTLAREFQPALPGVVGNPTALQQVFVNLITNALHSMPSGGVLTITTLTQAQHVEIRFRDTGRGVPPEHLARVFNPFFTTDRTGKGVGLGLSTCRNIMEQHGGTIKVESEVGRGSAFTLRLPCLTSAVDGSLVGGAG
ncbi:MAG: ATP-binding protein [Armatimonadota bacterium]|nr:ATP-binding protein [Armatimonadota bacterium]